MYSYRRKTRSREIDVIKLEGIKEGLLLEWKDVAFFLGVSSSQLLNYRRSGKLPADRFYAFKDALLIRCEERAREERERILTLFK